ncbi:hypothetical protein [Histophilus somni]|uniref:hypothetical protein n=1 Tax=Histophilus somni TaxID=731 RepID=UPI000039722F|nr:hypothetical protein [Histophilus somni]ACA30879.1 conserved hypothetical protein [Histophilus somni 2336]THA20846.1 hypothetical protein E5361_08970 [Histophilus somni]
MLANQEVTSVKLGYRKAILQELAQDFGGSVHSIVLDAVDSHIERLKAKQTYDRRAIQAYQDYQETGLHITLSEFMDWVDSLETDEPKDMPPCHK